MSTSTSPAKIPTLCNRLFRAFDDARSKKDKKYEPTESGTFEFSGWRMDLSPGSKCATPGDWDQISDLSETEILEQILTVFIGGDSDMIKVTNQSRRTGKKKFCLSPSIEPMQADFVKKCIPLAVYHSILTRFVEDNTNLTAGRVNQALAGGIDHLLLTEYAIFIEILEQKNRQRSLHLHELWYHIQNVMSSMKTMTELVLSITENKTHGGLTLTALHEYLNKIIAPITLDTHLCFHITKNSASPYMESVKQWIFNGVIYDPFNEFMIFENTRVRKDAYSEGYWENKYQLRNSMVPSFLDDVKHYILKAGKYLNAMKECAEFDQKPMNLPPIRNLEYSEEKEYNDVIIKAYKHTSKALLKYMLDEHKLVRRISTAKKYFLLQQGDFVVQILDTCNEELDKEINDVIPSRLATLVEMAIKTPTDEDLYITSCLKTLDLPTQVNKILTNSIQSNLEASLSEPLPLTGFEAFTLSIRCEWPVSLIFNTKVQSLYQMLFRHLFYCKHVERLLCDAWTTDQTIRDVRDLKPFYVALALRNKMILFLQNMENFIMEDAIEPAWMEFLQSLEECESVDDLIQNHWDFLEICIKDCFLTNLKMLTLFRKIVDGCRDTAKFLLEIGCLKNIEEYPSYVTRIDQLDQRFTENIIEFLGQILQMAERDSTGKLIQLYYRQNFNHFYKQKLVKTDSNVTSIKSNYSNV